MQKQGMIPGRTFIAYLYSTILILAGTFIVSHYHGMKLIEPLRRLYLATGRPEFPMAGFIEIDTIGLFLALLGSLTLLLVFLSNRFRQARTGDFLLIAVFNVFSLYFFLNAYICDDAFITFRTVDNFIHGYGLRWNTIERVQTFTNPLWMFLVTVPYGALYHIVPADDTTKMYFVAMFVSFAVSLAVMLHLTSAMKGQGRGRALLVLLAILFSSRAFVEYTSSGLENPLTYLFVALFYTRFFTDDNHREPSHLLFYFLCASLAFFNRMDAILIFVFPVAWLCVVAMTRHGWRSLRLFALGFLPAYGWLLFSLVYYGFPFPNSYYAKLGLGSADVVFKQGIDFLAALLVTDPASILAITGAIAAAFFLRDIRFRLTGAGLALSMIYVASTGGDFMGGRFVSAHVLAAALLIAYAIPRENPAPAPKTDSGGKNKKLPPKQPPFVVRHRFSLAVAVVFAVYNAAAPLSPLKTPFQASYIHDDMNPGHVFDVPGFTGNIYWNIDYYFASSPLCYSKTGFPFGNVKFNTFITTRQECRELRETHPSAEIGGGGLIGFCSGPDCQLVEEQVITNPLLARLPVPDISRGFLPGHIVKPIPAGLVDSYASGENRIGDPALRGYYEKIRTVTQGRLFTGERFRYILELNLTGDRRYTRSYF